MVENSQTAAIKFFQSPCLVDIVPSQGEETFVRKSQSNAIAGSVEQTKQYLDSLLAKSPEGLCVLQYRPNGSSYVRIGQMVVQKDQPFAQQVQVPEPQKPSTQQPSSTFNGFGEIANMKASFLEEQLQRINDDNQRLRTENQELRNRNITLEKENAVAEEKKNLELLKVSLEQSKTLSGTLNELSKPETIDALTKAYATITGKGAPVSDDGIMAGISGEKKDLIEALIALAKEPSRSSTQIAQLLVIAEHLLNHPDNLEQTYNYINNPQSIGQGQEEGADDE